ncbi:hypothetical protein [Hanstruepera marina]|uniref:hypothetical protein n=1 Tax=Hanstruepera marina TaxID=2873265 RepID=UPI001CA78C2E|nr:hypothetical protein [Hanstruepera marina]
MKAFFRLNLSKFKLLLFFICIVLYTGCSSSKIKQGDIRYFNHKNVELSEEKFYKIRSTNKYLDIPGDSINHIKLTVREKKGKIPKRSDLEDILEKLINREIDSTSPIVIIYHPGKDRCNSGGTANKAKIKNWHDQLALGLKRIANIEPIYIYKSYDGLQRYNGILNYYKDPNRIIESLFFEYHYPCSSYVVISKSGEYISYFGEFSKESVWRTTQRLTF